MKKPSAEELVLSEMFFHDGVFAARAGDLEGAVRAFEESLRFGPDNENTKKALKEIKSK